MRRILLPLASLGLAALGFTAEAVFAQPTYQPTAGRTLACAPGRVLDVHTGKETPDETVIITGTRS